MGRRRRLLPLLVAAVAIAAMVPVQGRIDASRKEHLHSGQAAPSARTPLEVIATAGLGGFRGLAIDYLWLRSMQMQDERRYYEIVFLGDLILRMEPYFTQVWSFQAWNMAYNISADLPQVPDRWQWIERAIELLAGPDGGIARNPNSYALYWELGWIYYHKCTPEGGDTGALYFMEQVSRSKAAEGLEGSPPSVTFQLARKLFLTAALKDDIPAAKARRARGLAIHCLEGMGMWTEAEEEWKKEVADSPPGDRTPRNAFISFYRKVIISYHQSDREGLARDWHKRYSRSFPNRAPSYEELLKRFEGVPESDAGH